MKKGVERILKKLVSVYTACESIAKFTSAFRVNALYLILTISRYVNSIVIFVSGYKH